MIERMLEPEVMDSHEEARDYNAMDHSEVNRLFVDDLFNAGFVGGDVLDVGTGTALIPIELCQRHQDCRVMAIDMATHMLDLGRYNIEAAGLIERINLAQIDAKNMPYPDQSFDAVISNSIIHHIPEPMVCIVEMIRVVKTGGLLFVRDLMRPKDEQSIKGLVQLHAGNDNDHQKKMFDDSLRAALSLEEIKSLIQETGFDPAQVIATSDRHWTWSANK
jgi:ubiquinone/menaquinone biosynthesis C-methylase UbiE